MSKRTGKTEEYRQAHGLGKTGLGSVRPFHALRQSVLAAVWHGAFFMTQKEVG